MAQGGKRRGDARAASRNYRRALRRGSKPDPRKWRNPPSKVPRWMRDKPMMKFGIGGTDKSHRGGRKMSKNSVYYSDKPAKMD